MCMAPPAIKRDGPSCSLVPFVPSNSSMGQSGCEVESIFLNVEAVNTHRERPQVRGKRRGGGHNLEGRNGTLKVPVSTAKGTQHLLTLPMVWGCKIWGETITFWSEKHRILYRRMSTSAAPRPKLWSPFLSTTEPPKPPRIIKACLNEEPGACWGAEHPPKEHSFI